MVKVPSGVKKDSNLAIYLLHFILISLPCLSLRAQINLVPNPGFDVLEFCPGDHGQLVSAMPWTSQTGTPDIFHTCATSVLYRAPYPYICMYVPPHNGEGYAGITVYGTREFLECNLTEPLQAGRPYYVRFYVAADENCHNQPPGFSDAISLMLRRSGDPNANFEIIAENSGQVITDTMNWTKISRCYYARGDERNVRIGNPKPDAQSIYETSTPDYPYPENYMFVDDVFIGTFDPFPDTMLLCEGMPLSLNATFLTSEYEWNTGETEAIKTVADTGRYIVQASIDGCMMRDTVVVISPPAGDLTLGDSLICDDEKIVLTAPLPGTYLWSDQSTSVQNTVDAPGLYSVTVTNECGEFVFHQTLKQDVCRCKVYVPNIFSPDRGQLLDISFGCEYEYTLDVFEVYSRWGEPVFTSRDVAGLSWDGHVNGKKLLGGVYVWRLVYTLNRAGKTLKITEQGDVTLIR